MSVSGWGVWSERECRPARRAGGTPSQEPAGAPAKPRTTLAHSDQDCEPAARVGFGSPQVWRESAQRTTARPQAIHAPQTPRSFSENVLLLLRIRAAGVKAARVRLIV